MSIQIPSPNEEFQNAKDSDKVTLTCTVWSTVEQDYYIAWSEKNGSYTDGITFLPEKKESGYMVTSLYTTTKGNWEKNTIECNVWPDGTGKVQHASVSKFGGNSVECS